MPATARTYPANVDIISEGADTTHTTVLISGMVSRFKTLADGSRHIVRFGIAGDMVDLQSIFFPVARFGVHTHMTTTALSVARNDLLAIAERHPDLMRILWLDTMIDTSIDQEWIMNLRRRATVRIAHFLMEMAARFDGIGELRDSSFPLPLTQEHLSEALGISFVHVNRTLQYLREQNYIRFRSRCVTIVDWVAMREISGFDATYLHAAAKEHECRQVLPCRQSETDAISPRR